MVSWGDLNNAYKTAKGVYSTVKDVKDDVKEGNYGDAIKTGLNAVGSLFDDDKNDKKAENSSSVAQNTSTQGVQNPEDIAQIVCQTLGLSKEQIPVVLNKAQTIAPKDKDGKSVLTIDAITSGAQKVVQLSQYAQQMNMYA